MRELDLSAAVATIRYSLDSVDNIREIFVSVPAQVAIIKSTSSQKSKLNFSIKGNTPFDNAMVKAVGSNEFYVSGQLPVDINSAGNYLNFPLIYKNRKGEKGMRYQYRIKV